MPSRQGVGEGRNLKYLKQSGLFQQKHNARLQAQFQDSGTNFFFFNVSPSSRNFSEMFF